MQYTTLGRTGLTVSVAGLGCGGFSRLGLGTGQSEQHAIGIVRQALDLGVTLIDTAAAYGTEEVVGAALQGIDRDRVVVCTKASKPPGEAAFSAAKVVESLDASLRRLRLDHVDVFQIHAVPPAAYDHVRDTVVPALLRQRDAGKFRFLGITETAPNDPEQVMLNRAAREDMWDTAMVAFHLMDQVARTQVFPHTMARGIGTLMMFAVRAIFARPAQLAATMKELAAAGQVPAWLADSDDPLGFLVHPAGASSVIDAAYRYVRHEPGADVVLFGTGDPAHLRTNIASILKPPLPQADLARLQSLFSHLRGVGLEAPPSRAR
ncbi:aldo/keto reductase [Rhodopila sp.]|jgi:aryl-alcohol dehydrogenase-like predicted oxidoreductase|uniref:aldo/keto reductase n=1 Tax=Rhodopila sp. TaxID=2480087 RepID=UPI002CE5322A|nr:aldo/keto reductase [Rhodopila sp.]HVZ07782.1 aldo/keto reductase [Rhodopila sp.]